MEIISDYPTIVSRIANIENIIKREGYEIGECKEINFRKFF